MSRVRNDLFDPRQGLDRGAPLWKECCWQLVKGCVFITWFPWPNMLKRGLLRLFGAKVGVGVVIKPRVHPYFPWKLRIGDHTWLGEEVLIMNLEPVHIGANCCISQRAFLCTGNHDFTDPAFRFMNKGIVVHDGAWIAASVFVAPGVEIGVDAVATAGSVVLQDLPPGMVCSGNPCLPVRPRWTAVEPASPLHKAVAWGTSSP